MHHAEPGAAVGELAVRAVDLTPRLEQLHDRLALTIKQAVQRATARRLVTQPIGPLLAHPGTPAQLTPLIKIQQPTRPAPVPAPRHSMLDELEQTRLDRRREPARDRAGGQSQRAFPSCRCSATACSVTVARNRAISSRASASSTCSAV